MKSGKILRQIGVEVTPRTNETSKGQTVMDDEDIKRIKRFSRKRVPRRQEREIPPRHQDPRKACYEGRNEILRALEEGEEEEDLLEEPDSYEEDLSPEDSEEDPEKGPNG